MNKNGHSFHYEWIRSAKIIFRNGTIGIVSCFLCVSHAPAMSHGPICLDIKQIDGKPAACLPMSDDLGSEAIRIQRVGVSRATGPASPDVIYWDLEVPASAQPVYLKRGECLVYGQPVAGAIIYTPPKKLDIDKTYGFSIIPVADYGPVYGAGFCVLKQVGGGVHIVQPAKGQQDLCPSGP